MRYMRFSSKITLMLIALLTLAAVGCGGDDSAEAEVVIQTVIVEKEVEVEKQVEVVVTATPILPPTATSVPANKPAPPSKQSPGELVWATGKDGGIGGGFNAVNLCCGGKMMSVVETLFKPTHEGGPATPLLAESWSLDSESSPPAYVDVTIQSGIQFHGGYGELTADDLVWNINDTNPNLSESLGTGNVSITDGSGTWAGFLGSTPTEKTGDYSVRINWVLKV